MFNFYKIVEFGFLGWQNLNFLKKNGMHTPGSIILVQHFGKHTVSSWFDGKLATQQGKFNTVFLSSFQYFMCSVALKVPKLKCFYASGRLFDCLFSLLITGGILSVLVLFQQFLVKEFEKADAISTAFLICNTCPKFFRTGNFLLAVAIIFCIQRHKNFDT